MQSQGGLKELEEGMNKENQREAVCKALSKVSVFGGERREPRAREPGQPLKLDRVRSGVSSEE